MQNNPEPSADKHPLWSEIPKEIQNQLRIKLGGKSLADMVLPLATEYINELTEIKALIASRPTEAADEVDYRFSSPGYIEHLVNLFDQAVAAAESQDAQGDFGNYVKKLSP